jgi:hypothetical protein
VLTVFDKLLPRRARLQAFGRQIDDRPIDLLERIPQGDGKLRPCKPGINLCHLDLHRSHMTRRAAGECGERCVFGLAQLAEPHYAGRRATLIALPQPLAQPGQGLAAKQPLKAGIDCHCGGKRRSGSSSLSPSPVPGPARHMYRVDALAPL